VNVVKPLRPLSGSNHQILWLHADGGRYANVVGRLEWCSKMTVVVVKAHRRSDRLRGPVNHQVVDEHVGWEGAEQVIAMIAPEVELLQNPASQTHGRIRQSKRKRLRPFVMNVFIGTLLFVPLLRPGFVSPQLRSVGTLAEVFSPIRFAFVKNGLRSHKPMPL